MSDTGGALVGVLVAAAALLAIDHVRARRPSLEARVAPYVGPPVSGRGARPQPVDGSGWRTLADPILRAAVARTDRLLGGRAALRQRLRRAGDPVGVDAFRAEQLAWAAGGFGGAFALVLLAFASGSAVSPVAALGLCACAALGGALLRDQQLSRAISRREERVAAEFPAVAELLALAVAAGEGAAGAVARTARTADGVMAAELAIVVADTRTGVPFVDALRALSRRVESTAVTRFVEGVAIAVERGTPLSDVLRAQAADARDLRRTQLMESAGRREIAMLVPVVFLILPVTVVFALFPGFYGLSLSVP